MAGEVKKLRNLIFFYHKNHNDKFNGTSVYDKAMLNVLRKNYNITTVEPDLDEVGNFTSDRNSTHYFVHLVKSVYLRQILWLLNILRGNHLTPPNNTILLVEDIYSAPVPLLVSKLKGYKLIFRVADFGRSYSKSLFENHIFDSLIYSLFRRFMERLMIHNSSLIICPSENIEAAIIDEYSNSRNKVVLLPYVRTDLSKIHEKQESGNVPESIGNKIVLLFMGDFRYPPNNSAGNYVVNELIPKLNGHSGDYEVLIAGKNSHLFYCDSPNVKILGAVDNIEELFSKVHIGLAPMRTVGGLSMKVVDYLIHGLRVVATPEAAFGIGSNSQMTIAELSDFAKAVEGEVIHALNNGHDFHKLSVKVKETYMSDKWEINLLKRINSIGMTAEN